MGKKIDTQVYYYRKHKVSLAPDCWQITGPALTAKAYTVREAYQMIDQHPATPPKMSRKEAGKLGATVTWNRYHLVPVDVNNFAIVSRTTGETVNYINGKHW